MQEAWTPSKWSAVPPGTTMWRIHPTTETDTEDERQRVDSTHQDIAHSNGQRRERGLSSMTHPKRVFNKENWIDDSVSFNQYLLCNYHYDWGLYPAPLIPPRLHVELWSPHGVRVDFLLQEPHPNLGVGSVWGPCRLHMESRWSPGGPCGIHMDSTY